MFSSSLASLAISLVLLPLALFSLVDVASANTEIRNFRVGPVAHESISRSRLDTRANRASVDVTRTLLYTYLHVHPYPLNATHNERSFRVKPAPLGTPLLSVCEGDLGHKGGGEARGGCLNEVWLELDLGVQEWRGYDGFIVRVSWPAFYPVDFDITVFSPEELEGYVESRFGISRLEGVGSSDTEKTRESRIKYTRIRLVDTGIRAPIKVATSPSSASSFGTHQTTQGEAEPVPFTVIIEPLLFGIIPASLIPTLLFLIPLLALVYPTYLYVMRYLEGVVDEARKELYGVEEREQKRQ